MANVGRSVRNERWKFRGSFDYSRDWLISEGQSVYEAAVEDPETLANLDGADEDTVDRLYPKLAAKYW